MAIRSVYRAVKARETIFALISWQLIGVLLLLFLKQSSCDVSLKAAFSDLTREL